MAIGVRGMGCKTGDLVWAVTGHHFHESTNTAYLLCELAVQLAYDCGWMMIVIIFVKLLIVLSLFYWSLEFTRTLRPPINEEAAEK